MVAGRRSNRFAMLPGGRLGSFGGGADAAGGGASLRATGLGILLRGRPDREGCG